MLSQMHHFGKEFATLRRHNKRRVGIGLGQIHGGTTLWCDLLKSHPEIDCVVHEAFGEAWMWQDPTGYLNSLPGENVFLEVQLNSHAFRSPLLRWGYPIIHFTRRNYVRAAISLNRRHFRAGEDIPRGSILDIAMARETLDYVVAPFVTDTVDYNDITEDGVKVESVQNEHTDRILTALGYTPARLYSSFAELYGTDEILPDNYRELLSINEVCRA